MAKVDGIQIEIQKAHDDDEDEKPRASLPTLKKELEKAKDKLIEELETQGKTKLTPNYGKSYYGKDDELINPL